MVVEQRVRLNSRRDGQTRHHQVSDLTASVHYNKPQQTQTQEETSKLSGEGCKKINPVSDLSGNVQYIRIHQILTDHPN